MTAKDYFRRYDLPLDFVIKWTDEMMGWFFYKRRSFDGIRYFLPKEQAVTLFDVLRFVAIHNLEDYEVMTSWG